MIRRLWRVLADPPASDFASFLRNVALPVGVVLAVARLVFDVPGSTPVELVWVFILLAVTRQRDDARRALAKDVARLLIADGAVSASRVDLASGHPHNPPHPPADATGPPAPNPAITPRHRNEDT